MKNLIPFVLFVSAAVRGADVTWRRKSLERTACRNLR